MPPEAQHIPVMDWAQFGLAGLVIAALFGYLIFLYKSHQAERTEWRTDAHGMQEESTRAIDNLQKVTMELTMAIKELIYRQSK